MDPSLSIPTDNIYKFACLFGLALIIVSVISFVTMYTATLDRKVRYSEVIIPLEASASRSKPDTDVLNLNKKLLEITRTNERVANGAITILLSVGLALSIVGALSWYKNVQVRDDRLVQLQMRKLEAEVAKLEAEVRRLKAGFDSPQAAGNDDG
jgi:cell division protein FtsB